MFRKKLIVAMLAGALSIMSAMTAMAAGPGDTVQVTHWEQVDGGWTYLYPDNSRATGWIKDKGVWYFLNADGLMTTGWQKVDNAWYYMNGSGAMQTGWIEDNGSWYFLNDSGVMAADTYIDKYYVDGSGRWTKTRSAQELRDDAVGFDKFWGLDKDDDSDSSSNDYTTSSNSASSSSSSSSSSLDFSDYDDENEDVTTIARDIADIVNKERTKRGLAALSWDSTLAEAAQIRAEELTEKYSHTRPDETKCFTVLDEVGYDYGTAGENIAYGQTSAKAVMTAWMNSQGHKENILNKSVDEIGVGVYRNGRTLYYAQLFGKRY